MTSFRFPGKDLCFRVRMKVRTEVKFRVNGNTFSGKCARPVSYRIRCFKEVLHSSQIHIRKITLDEIFDMFDSFELLWLLRYLKKMLQMTN